MRKISLFILSFIIISVLGTSSVSALAADWINSPTADVLVAPVVTVNDSTDDGSDVIFNQSEDNPYMFTFYYNGKAILRNWEHNLTTLGFKENVDYVINEDDEKVLTITFISNSAKSALKDGKIIINAVVDNTNIEVSTDKNSTSKSPDTGSPISIVSGSFAFIIAGVTALMLILFLCKSYRTHKYL